VQNGHFTPDNGMTDDDVKTRAASSVQPPQERVMYAGKRRRSQVSTNPRVRFTARVTRGDRYDPSRSADINLGSSMSQRAPAERAIVLWYRPDVRIAMA